MKQNINLGSTVDDGTGDYLRQGGEKINTNFDELYTELGNGQRPFSAGAWHLVDSGEIVTFDADFGRAYVIDTTTSPVDVNLPNGEGTDYGKSIKLRDVFNTWNENNVTIYPATGDTIKGSNNGFVLYRDLQDIELVYTKPGRWEFVDNKLINRITVSDIPSVAKKEFVATDGQTDFTDIFNTDYNPINLEVYRRGNLLYYGDQFSEDSDYGSLQDPEDPLVEGIVALDGNTVRLREPCDEGDTITIISYADNLTNYRTSYNSHTVKVFDANDTNIPASSQEILVIDGLSSKKVYTLQDLGLSELAYVNPQSFELFVNGRQLTNSSEIGEPNFQCIGATGNDQPSCESNGGSWEPTAEDYHLFQNENGKYDRFFIISSLETGDILTVKWFDNQIGTLQQWEGSEGIREQAENIFINSEYRFDRSGKIRYIDPENPEAATTEEVAGTESNIRWDNVTSLLESIFPIGSIYSNANNPNNPSEYMGFGKWVRFGTGKVPVGWNPSTDPFDANFGLNNNDLDENDVPRHTAGGTGGSVSVELSSDNIPQLTSGKEVLVVDENGSVIIGSCQDDPDENGPAVKTYSEEQLNVNDGVTTPNDVSTLQPYITVHRWVRTE